MAYGFESRLFLENGPAIHAARARFARSSRSARAWRDLNEQSRLELIENALDRPANDDFPDGLPVAL
jgi:hypothetical protein